MFFGKREGVFVMLMKHLLYPFHKGIFLKGVLHQFRGRKKPKTFVIQSVSEESR